MEARLKPIDELEGAVLLAPPMGNCLRAVVLTDRSVACMPLIVPGAR